MSEEKRVVLIKPGDALILGNMGDLSPMAIHELGDRLRSAGFPIVLFAEPDATLDSLTLADARALVELLERKETPCGM